MSEYLNKKKIRNSLINYFKLIAKCQKQIQSIQEKLILHPRFQPLILFKKIAGHNSMMDLKDLKQYFRKKIGVKRQEGIKMYFIKYGFDGDFISCETFLETLLPFTPNTLRDVNETITRQLQTQHLDMTVEQIYHNLILKTTQSLYTIRLFQQFISLKKWQKVQNFMAEDLNEKAKKIDLTIKQQTDVIYIRKWMQLWVNVDEYEVLNLMRFFGGGSEKNIMKLFNNDIKISTKCTCGCMKQNGHQNNLNQDYYTSIDSNKSLPKIRFFTESQSTSNRRVNSSAKSIKKSKNYQESSSNNDVQQISTFIAHQEENIQKQNLQLLKFKTYLTTLVESQKYLDFNRLILVPYKKQCDQILHDILSKKSNSTSIEKILMYIEKYLQLKRERFDKLLQQVGNTKVQNRVIFSVFNSEVFAKKTGNKYDPMLNSKKLSLKQILQVVSYILYNFIQTKNKLIKFSSQIIEYPVGDLIKNILRKIGKDEKSQKIKISDLKDFLSMWTKKSIGKEYLNLIINHLGDGTQITHESLEKVLLKQSKQKINKQKNLK